MVAQRGRDLLLKIFVAGSFVTVAGLRSNRISFNAESVDVTDRESSGRWRELLGAAGMQRAAISGSGIFKDQQSDATLRQSFFDAEINDFQVIIPDFGTLTGPFQITALEYSGSHNGELAFDMALESAGPVIFEAL